MNKYNATDLLREFGGNEQTCKREVKRVTEQLETANALALHMNNIEREQRRVAGLRKAAAVKRSSKRKPTEG